MGTEIKQLNPITQHIQKYSMVYFYILACFFGWILYIIAPFTGIDHPENIPLGPVVGLLVVLAFAGSTERQYWISKLRTKRTSRIFYAIAAAMPIVLVLISVGFNRAFGAPLPTLDQWKTGLIEAPVVFVLMLIAVGIGEEAAWTAYATPKLLERYSFFKTYVIMATIRIFWHLPLMLSGDLPWSLGIIGNASFQFLLLVIYTKGDEDWRLAAVWHSMLNAFSGNFLFSLVKGADNARLGLIMSLLYAAAAIVAYNLVQNDNEYQIKPFTHSSVLQT